MTDALKTGTASEAGPQAAGAGPFGAVPCVMDGVEVRRDARGRVQIRKPLVAGRGLSDWLARTLKFRRDIRVNLDERGSWFWDRIDGRRSLEHIENAMRREMSLPEDESRRAVLMFTRMLMLRQLIALKMPGRTENT